VGTSVGVALYIGMICGGGRGWEFDNSTLHALCSDRSYDVSTLSIRG